MSNCQKNTSTCGKRYGDSTCGKNISCNCAGFQYDGSAGNPNLNYYSGVVPWNKLSKKCST